MAKPELIRSVSDLVKKIDSLLSLQKKLQDRVAALETQNRELMKQHTDDVSSLEKAKREIDFLTISHRLADSPEALVSARNEISKLIRTIDNCIRMIKED